MDHARKKGSSGESEVYLAAVLHPEKEGMCCAFRKCVGQHEVDVHFVETRGIEGDRYRQNAHYATNAGQRKKHHPECNLVSDFDDAASKSETIKQAVIADKTILINLNLNPDAARGHKPKGARSS